VSTTSPSEIIAAADASVASIRAGGQIIFMGNGGSSADAQHLAAELSGRYLFDRPAMAGVCLSNIAPVTAIGNDYSFELVFKRQIEAICRKGDVVIGLSTSGNSKNVILALEAAKARGAVTVAFTGEKGKMREIADLTVTIHSDSTPCIQAGMLAAGHAMCDVIERTMYGRRAVLIDRDDTIAKDVPYCSRPEDMHLFPGVPEAIAKLNRAGFLVIVVTNQSAIGRGMIDEIMLTRIHDKMKADIAVGGGHVDDIFFCPHHPDENCECRKPKLGLGMQAIAKYHIDTRSSYMIGDADKDVQFGQALGCRTIRVTPEYTFAQAVDDMLRMERC
jgi:histidinol-phosphate phosphatase family protein